MSLPDDGFKVVGLIINEMDEASKILYDEYFKDKALEIIEMAIDMAYPTQNGDVISVWDREDKHVANFTIINKEFTLNGSDEAFLTFYADVKME